MLRLFQLLSLFCFAIHKVFDLCYNELHTYIYTSRLVHLNTQVQPVQYFLNECNRIAALFLAQGIVNRTAAVTPVGGLMNIKDPSFRLPRLDTSNMYFMNIERFSWQKLE